MRASLLHPGDDSGPQLPKIKCAFHSNELLTNFCSCRGCLLPLCPSCIKIHINEHIVLKTNPQLQNITDLLRNLHGRLESYSEKFNELYKQLANVEFCIEQFRQKVKAKIHQVKYDLIAAVQDHFKRIEVDALQKVNELKYIKYVSKCKDITKKVILSLKSSERNFFAEENKIMRMMIKFQSNKVSQELDSFYRQSQHFVNVSSSELLSFHISNNMVQLAVDNLHSSFKIDFQQPNSQNQPKDITPVIKELYEKQSDKREIKKSLYKFLSTKNTPNKQTQSHTQFQCIKVSQPVYEDKIKDFAEIISSKQAMSVSQARPQLHQIQQNNAEYFDIEHGSGIINTGTYSSVKQSIVRATQDLSMAFCRNNRRETENQHTNQRRRSISKGKGITLIQPNMNVLDYKKGSISQSLLNSEIDMAFLNSKTQQIPRKYR